jgi:hypothetical protein
MTKRPVPPKQLNPSAFKAQNVIFAQRLTERVWRVGDTDFVLRPLTNRQMTFVTAQGSEAEMRMWLIKLGVKAIKHEGYTAKFEDMEILGREVSVLSDDTFDELPQSMKVGKETRPFLPTLAGAITMLSNLSSDEIEKLDFFLPCENAT